MNALKVDSSAEQECLFLSWVGARSSWD